MGSEARWEGGYSAGPAAVEKAILEHGIRYGKVRQIIDTYPGTKF